MRTCLCGCEQTADVGAFVMGHDRRLREGTFDIINSDPNPPVVKYVDLPEDVPERNRTLSKEAAQHAMMSAFVSAIGIDKILDEGTPEQREAIMRGMIESLTDAARRLDFDKLTDEEMQELFREIRGVCMAEFYKASTASLRESAVERHEEES